MIPINKSKFPLITLFILCLSYQGIQTLMASDTIRVPVCDVPSTHHFDQDGYPLNFGRDLLNWIAKEEGWVTEEVHLPFKDIEKELLKGEIDIDPMFIHSKESNPNISLSTTPLHNTWGTIVSKKTNEIESLYAMEGLRVGFCSGITTNRILLQKLTSRNISFTAIEFDSFGSMTRSLEDNEIDCMVTGELFRYSNYFKPTLRTSTLSWHDVTFRFAIAKDGGMEEKFSTIENYLKRLSADKESVFYKKKRTHFTSHDKYLTALQLTGQQKEWLSKNDTIHLYFRNHYPVSFIEDNEIKGVLPDFFEILFNYYNIEHEYHSLGPLDQIGNIEQVNNAVILGIGTFSEVKNFVKTDPVIQTQYRLIVTNDQRNILDLSNLEKGTIALPFSSLNLKRMRLEYPQLSFLKTNGRRDGLDKLLDGYCEAAIVEQRIFDGYIQIPKYKNLVARDLRRDYTPDIGCAVVNTSPALLSLLNDFIAIKPHHMIDQMVVDYVEQVVKREVAQKFQINLFIFSLAVVSLLIFVAFRQIRGKKKLIEKERNTLNSVLNSIKEGIITIDTKGVITNTNTRCYTILGIEDTSIVGKTVHELIQELDCVNYEDFQIFVNKIYNQSTQKTTANSTFIIEKDRPQKKYISCQVTLRSESKKKELGIVLTVSDITENHLYQNRLSTVNEALKQTEKTAEVGWFEADIENKTFSMAESIFNVLEMEYCEELGSEWLIDTLSPEQFELFRSELLSNKEKFKIDIPFNVKGKKYWFHIASVNVTVSGNKIRTRKGYIQNITERKIYEIKIKQSQQQLLSIFENSPTGLVVCANNGTRMKENQLAEKYLQCIRPEAKTKINLFDIDYVSDYFKEKVKKREDVCVVQQFNVLTPELYHEETIHLEIVVKHYNRNGEPTDPGILILMIDRTTEYNNQETIRDQFSIIQQVTETLNLDIWTANILENPENDLTDFNLRYPLKPDKETLNMQSLLQNVKNKQRDLTYLNISKLRSGIIENHSQELRTLIDNNICSYLFCSNVTKYEPENNQILLSGIQLDTTNIRHTQNSLEMAQEAANLGSWECNIAARTLSISQVVQNILEVPKNEQSDFNTINFNEYASNPRSIIKKLYTERQNSHQQIKFDIEITTRKNAKKKLHVIGKKVFINHHNIEILQGIVQDVTEIREAESKLIKAQQEQEMILNNVSNGVVFLSPELDITWSNKTAKNLFSNKNLTTNCKCYRTFYKTEKPCKSCPVIDSIKSKKIEHSVLKQPNGRIYRISSVPIYNDDGSLKGIVESFDDFTLLRKREEELKKERCKAEESDRLKSSFLANLSHEIRSPLSNIIGFTRLIARKNYPKAQKDQFIRMIENNQNTLLNLINDVLDLSKIEANIIDIQREIVDVDQLCSDLVESMSLDLSSEVKLHYVPFTKSLMLLSDKTKLTQILNNLVSNSKKFTRQGGIWIYVDHLEKEKVVEFRISDTGIGIYESHINTIFDRFDKGTSKEQGTGLGLSICKAIVTKLGGNIRVESEPNIGTTFIFTIPYSGSTNTELAEYQIEKAWTSPSTKEEQEDQRPNILVAEDNNNNFLYMETLLHQDFHVNRASDGIEAVEICKNGKVDLVLMDIMMPNMDGFEATSLIRKENPSIPIIAVSAFEKAEIKKRGGEVIFNDLISKPFEDSEIFAKIKTHLNTSTAEVH